MTPRYCNNKLAKAVAACKSGKSVRSVAKSFGIPRSTLQQKLKNNELCIRKMGRPTHLTENEEKEFVAWIIKRSRQGLIYFWIDSFLINYILVCRSTDKQTSF